MTLTPLAEVFSTQAELFVIPNEVIAAVSCEEVEASYRDMEELGIAKLPYRRIDIRVSLKAMSTLDPRLLQRTRLSQRKELNEKSTDPQKICNIQFYDDGTATSPVFLDIVQNVNKKDATLAVTHGVSLSLLAHLDEVLKEYPDRIELKAKQQKYFFNQAHSIRRLLIVLLATKNIIKTRVENKRLRLGIGHKNPRSYRYTTTITLPPPGTLEAHNEGNGSSPRPHLRRGHIRNQHHGYKNSLIKRIWIAPCFVNADETFVSSRTAYDLKAPLLLGEVISNQLLADQSLRAKQTEQLSRAEEFLNNVVTKLVKEESGDAAT